MAILEYTINYSGKQESIFALDTADLVEYIKEKYKGLDKFEVTLNGQKVLTQEDLE